MGESQDRKLAAIMFTDMVGYSALTQKNEALTLELLHEYVDTVRPVLAAHGGIEIKTMGDGFLVEFASALQAADCAIEIQERLRERNSATLRERQILVRIGLHVGDVVHHGDDVFGDAVNIAARIEPLAKHGGICLSEDVARQIRNKIKLPILERGKSELKNIQLPVNIYEIHLPWEKISRIRLLLLPWRRVVGTLAALLVVVGVAWFVWRRAGEQKPPPLELTFNGTNTPVNAAAVSPDGKYLAYVDISGIFLKVLGSSNAEPIQIPQQQHFWFETAEWQVAWFPDSTRFLVSGSAESGETTSIWSISISDKTPRKLSDHGLAPAVSPDGSHVAFISADDREIWVMSENGETPHVILTAQRKEEWFEQLAWSPEADRLAYIKACSAPDDCEASLEILDLKEKKPRPVLSNRALLVLSPALCWTGDGRVVFSLGEKGGREAAYSNLWEIKPNSLIWRFTKKPKRLTKETGFYFSDLSVTSDGKHLAYLKFKSQDDIYVGELEGRGTGLRKPKGLVLRQTNDRPTGWTGDSKAVLFYSDPNGVYEIFEQPVDGSPAQAFVPGAEMKAEPRLAPDGAWILYWAWPRSGGLQPKSKHLMRYPILGGPPQDVLRDTSGNSEFRCARQVMSCVLSREESEQLVFSAFDPAQGRLRPLTKVKVDQSEGYDWDLSPDGRQIAVVQHNPRKGRVSIIDLPDGAIFRDVQIEGWAGLRDVGWSAHSDGLFLTSVRAGGSTLLYVDLNGRARGLWQPKKEKENVSLPVSSPDGRHLAFAVSATSDSNVWMLENF